MTRITVTVSADVDGIDVFNLIRRARELDDENMGEHQDSYTAEQAFAVVLNFDPAFLTSPLRGYWAEAGRTGHPTWSPVEDTRPVEVTIDG